MEDNTALMALAGTGVAVVTAALALSGMCKDGPDSQQSTHPSSIMPKHCVRCHESYTTETLSTCLVEHDTEGFEGSRNGTDYYCGSLACCGASHKFHRHGSFEESNPAHCFEGNHTEDASIVKYTKGFGASIKICSAKRCGEERAAKGATALADLEARAQKKQEEEAAKYANADGFVNVFDVPGFDLSDSMGDDSGDGAW
jgi:hypothetical protein